MVSVTNDAIIERIAGQLEVEKDRYYFTVHLSLGMLDFLERNPELGFRFVSCDSKMPPTVNADGTPMTNCSGNEGSRNDMLLQNSENNKGILIEVKTSYPENERKFSFALEEDIRQLKNLDRDVLGWKCAGGKIDQYCLVFMPYHQELPEKAVRSIERRLRQRSPSKGLRFRHPFAVWWWVKQANLKTTTQADIIQISPSSIGRRVGWKLGELLDKHFIVIDLDSLFARYEYDKYRFGREPPSNCRWIPVIEAIYFFMSSKLRTSPEGEYLCSVNDLMNLATEYFPPWIPDDTKGSQLRKRWVKSALDLLVNIDIAKLLPDRETYALDPLTARNKDFSKYVCTKIAKFINKTEKAGAATPLNARVEAMNLDEFQEH